MCTSCGCVANGEQDDGSVCARGHVHTHANGLLYRHAHRHAHAHDGVPAEALEAGTTRRVQVERDILAKNNALACINRQRLEQQGILTINLVSSPGAGKTLLLQRSIAKLHGKFPLAVIEGDQQTSLDADRIRACGAAAVQVNTGKGCHLDAQMVQQALTELALPQGGLLFVENVGNLVCPASFDLGEMCKVLILSVTEGEDKPLKYPDMFRASRLLLLNKCDLLPYLEFDVRRVIDNARRVNPEIEVIQLSALTGEGVADWLAWLESEHAALKASAAGNVDALRRQVADLEARLTAL